MVPSCSGSVQFKAGSCSSGEGARAWQRTEVEERVAEEFRPSKRSRHVGRFRFLLQKLNLWIWIWPFEAWDTSAARRVLMNTCPPRFVSEFYFSLFWVEGHLAWWCQMTLNQSSCCIKGFQCLSFYYVSVRIWAVADKNNNSTTRPAGPPSARRRQSRTKLEWKVFFASSMWFRDRAILGSGVKGNFDSSRLKSLALLLVNQHLSETAEKLTFQKTENNPR